MKMQESIPLLNYATSDNNRSLSAVAATLLTSHFLEYVFINFVYPSKIVYLLIEISQLSAGNVSTYSSESMVKANTRSSLLPAVQYDEKQ